MFENFRKKQKTEKKISQEEREKRIKSNEHMTGLSALNTTTELLDKVDQIADAMKTTENHDGDYVETEYDLKKAEMQQHVKENLIKKSKWLKATVIQGLITAGLVTDLLYGGPISKMANQGLEADQVAYLATVAGGVLATTVSAGVSIVKGIKNRIKEKIETNKAMARFMVAKAEGHDDKEADIIARSSDIGGREGNKVYNQSISSLREKYKEDGLEDQDAHKKANRDIANNLGKSKNYEKLK